MRVSKNYCDRCNKEYRPYTSDGGNSGFQFFRHATKAEREENGRKLVYNKPHDLCPDCMNELEDWYFDEDVDVSPEVNETSPEPEIEIED